MNLKEKIRAKVVIWMAEGILKGNTLRRRLALTTIKSRILKEKKMLDNLRKKISGKKTYLVAVVGMLGAVLAWVNGSVETTEMVNTVIGCILSMTIRSGIAKK